MFAIQDNIYFIMCIETEGSPSLHIVSGLFYSKCLLIQSHHLFRVLLLQDLCEHSTGISSRSGVLSPSSLLANQSGEILGMAREMAQAKAGCGQSACGVEDVLQLLRILYIIGGDSASNTRTMQEGTKAGDGGKVKVQSFCSRCPFCSI